MSARVGGLSQIRDRTVHVEKQCDVLVGLRKPELRCGVRFHYCGVWRTVVIFHVREVGINNMGQSRFVIVPNALPVRLTKKANEERWRGTGCIRYMSGRGNFWQI